MPLTAKGEEILSHLTEEYGAEKGKSVLYAGKNKGTFTGIDAETPDPARLRNIKLADAERRMLAIADDMRAMADDDRTEKWRTISRGREQHLENERQKLHRDWARRIGYTKGFGGFDFYSAERGKPNTE